MNETDFQDLLAEIDSMSIEEYNKFHEEALRMKESRIYIELLGELSESKDNVSFSSEYTIHESFSTKSSLLIDSQFAAFYRTADTGLTENESNGERIWPEAA